MKRLLLVDFEEVSFVLRFFVNIFVVLLVVGVFVLFVGVAAQARHGWFLSARHYFGNMIYKIIHREEQICQMVGRGLVRSWKKTTRNHPSV
jgi:hypothetical protein